MYKIAAKYGIGIGILIFGISTSQILFTQNYINAETYFGFIALTFTGLGIFYGSRIRKEKVIIQEIVKYADSTNIEEEELYNELSQREKEVLRCIAEGMTNQDIASSLFISLNTVKTHVKNIYLKLDVKRRTQAVSKARELKILK